MKDQGCWAIEILMIGNFNINERNFEKYLKVEKFPNQFWPILSWIPFDIYSANIKMETLKRKWKYEYFSIRKSSRSLETFLHLLQQWWGIEETLETKLFRFHPGKTCMMIDLYHILTFMNKPKTWMNDINDSSRKLHERRDADVPSYGWSTWDVENENAFPGKHRSRDSQPWRDGKFFNSAAGCSGTIIIWILLFQFKLETIHIQHWLFDAGLLDSLWISSRTIPTSPMILND